ncbi:C40 family peptidase [Cellulomonas sp. SLBN-39]|uniref:C40 family peptidase n=1 Tax=Cellulomonas sp. SLBN-39 TaxID=2768446 RepID=UPI00114EAABC|nr:C40 family peptidase [Cellulomonas sp. SLBN-39]TQL01633.1 cell wall-associated NlpC family hydrolase [Cellulomonas sp. SLBN-39]
MSGVVAMLSRVAEIRAFVQAPAPTSVRSAATAPASTEAFAAALGLATGATAAPTVTGAATTVPTTSAPTTAAPTTAAAPVTAAGGATGDALVAAASAYLGQPYVWGGESLAEGGFDCSGLVQRSLADIGVTGVPRTAREQMTTGTEVPSLDDARPGDLVVLGGGSHIGIYVGEGKMIDAPRPGRTVTVRDVYAEPTTIRRLLPDAAPTAAAASAQARALASFAGVTS